MEIDKVKLISKLEHANLEINLTLASAVNFNVKFIYRHPSANAFFVAAQNPRYAKFALRES